MQLHAHTHNYTLKLRKRIQYNISITRVNGTIAIV